MNSARVSVVMPAYNAGDYVAEAIASVVAQTFTDWELIVVDDGSSDDTLRIARSSADARVRVIAAPHSGLPAVARNLAIGDSSGDVVAFIDADDVWLPTKLAAQVGVLDREPSVGVVHCAARVLGAPDEPVAEPPDDGRDLVSQLLENNFIYNSSVALRRALLEDHGALDPEPALRGSEDYELWLRLAAVTRFAYLDEPLLLYRRHGTALTTDEGAMAVSGLAARTRTVGRDSVRAAAHPQLLRSLGIARILAGDSSGRRDLALAVRRRPRDLRAWKWLGLSLLGPSVVGALRARRR